MYDSHPTMVDIEVTDKCNSECAVCPRNIHGGAIHENIKNIQLGVDYFKLLGDDFMTKIRQWNFCGTRGDAMANTELVEIIEYIRSKTPEAYITLRTNGGMGKPEQFKRLSELIGHNGYLCFSVDGWEETNEIYRKNVKWHKVRANMDAYMSGPGIMHWDFIVFKHNYHQIDFATKFAEENNIHLELKEPFGFEGGAPGNDNEFVEGTWELKRTVYTMPVYNRRTGEFMYEIEPETEHRIPTDMLGIQPHGMGDRYYGAEIIKRDFPAKQNIKSYRNEWPDLEEYKHIRNNTVEYNCEAIDKNELFIDCDGQFLPCCFLASAEFMEEPQMMNMLSTVDTTLHYPTETWRPEDILNSKFFKKTIPDGFAGKLDDVIGSCHTCVNMCGKQTPITQ